MEQYDLPLYQRSKMKWSWNLLFIFCALLFAGFSIFSFTIMMNDDLITGLLCGLFFSIFCFFFVYIIISVGMLKSCYIEMTAEYIKVKFPFKSKAVYWNEIYKAQVYKYNNNTMITILLKKDVNKKKKRTISNNFNSIYGAPSYSFQISLMLFKDLDAQKLLLTMGEQINRADQNEDDNTDIINVGYDANHNNNNIFMALITSILSYIIISAIYGIVIYKLETNYLVIPLFGSFLIISIFNKYYLEKAFRLSIRFTLGLICLLQIPTAIIIDIMISEKINVTAINVINVTYEYFNYIIHTPFENILIILCALGCFTIGGLKGRIK